MPGLSKEEFKIYKSISSRRAIQYNATSITLSILSAVISSLSLALKSDSCSCSGKDEEDKKSASSLLTVLSILLTILSMALSSSSLTIKQTNQILEENIDPPKIKYLCVR